MKAYFHAAYLFYLASRIICQIAIRLEQAYYSVRLQFPTNLSAMFQNTTQEDLEFGAIANTKNILFRLGFCKSSPADFFHGFYNTTLDLGSQMKVI